MAALGIGGRRACRTLRSPRKALCARRPVYATMSMTMPATWTASTRAVQFPYGFPHSRGDYRIFVQMKRAGRVETGAFDARVQ